MPELLMLLSCLSDSTSKPLFNQLIVISEALLSMRGRITMLGISLWTLGKDGGSYRSIQRFFNKTIPWMSFQWTLIRTHLLSSEDVILLAGDETTVTKSGKSTFGLDRFFSSIYERAVPGVSYLNLSIISVTGRKAYPLIMAQAEPSPKAKPTAKPKVNGTAAKKKKKKLRAAKGK